MYSEKKKENVIENMKVHVREFKPLIAIKEWERRREKMKERQNVWKV